MGNWTLERDEDLTGPYAFLGNKWIAFDDDTSLKIKAKYVLLRDLAGVGLMSVDADDIANGDVVVKANGKLLKPARLASGLFQFRKGSGEDRVVLDCITSLQK